MLTNYADDSVFSTPELGEAEMAVVEEVEELRKNLRLHLGEPRRWFGSLRRLSFARAIQGSNSIEGYDAALDDAAAAADGDEPIDGDQETRLALAGYREAMTYVLQLATEEALEVSDQLLKSLHFMITNHDLKSRPGLWRAGDIFVHDGVTDKIAYEGADLELVPSLMKSLCQDVNLRSNTPVLVRAGMAHLNLVMIHPFRDGNGRMARCLQTLVLAREGVLAPQFCSIEEYLGANTRAYYDILQEVGGRSWQPERDALPWVRFILTAHLRQAKTLLRRVKESEQLWISLERITSGRGLPDRMIPVLYDAALGLRVRNATYRAINEEVSEQVASRDLKLLVAADLLIPHGERRGRFYVASDEVAAVNDAIKAKRPHPDDADPFGD